jgi:hypothetical protein
MITSGSPPSLRFSVAVSVSTTSESVNIRAVCPRARRPMARARSSGLRTLYSPVLKPTKPSVASVSPSPVATGASAFMPTAVMLGSSA